MGISGRRVMVNFGHELSLDSISVEPAAPDHTHRAEEHGEHSPSAIVERALRVIRKHQHTVTTDPQGEEPTSFEQAGMTATQMYGGTELHQPTMPLLPTRLAMPSMRHVPAPSKTAPTPVIAGSLPSNPVQSQASKPSVLRTLKGSNAAGGGSSSLYPALNMPPSRSGRALVHGEATRRLRQAPIRGSVQPARTANIMIIAS